MALGLNGMVTLAVPNDMEERRHLVALHQGGISVHVSRVWRGTTHLNLAGGGS